MESKKLEKPRENGTFSTVQGVMKPDEEGRRVFPTMKPLGRTQSRRTQGCRASGGGGSPPAHRFFQGGDRAPVSGYGGL